MDRIWPSGLAWIVEDVHRADQRVETRVRGLEFDADSTLVLFEWEVALEDAKLLQPDACPPEGTTRRTLPMWKRGALGQTTLRACENAVERSGASKPQFLRQDRLWLGFGQATVRAVFRDSANGRPLYTTDLNMLIIPLGWIWALLVLMSLPALSQCTRRVAGGYPRLGQAEPDEARAMSVLRLRPAGHATEMPGVWPRAPAARRSVSSHAACSRTVHKNGGSPGSATLRGPRQLRHLSARWPRHPVCPPGSMGLAGADC